MLFIRESHKFIEKYTFWRQKSSQSIHSLSPTPKLAYLPYPQIWSKMTLPSINNAQELRIIEEMGRIERKFGLGAKSPKEINLKIEKTTFIACRNNAMLSCLDVSSIRKSSERLDITPISQLLVFASCCSFSAWGHFRFFIFHLTWFLR